MGEACRHTQHPNVAMFGGNAEEERGDERAPQRAPLEVLLWPPPEERI